MIGNPPFNPISGLSKKNAVSESQIQLFGIRNKDIPNNNFALKFFEGAMFFGKKTCLILPSNVLLYNKTKSAQKYRNRIFTKFTVEKIFDFTYLRKLLFFKKSPKHANVGKQSGKVAVSVCAVFANAAQSKGQKIEHTVVKRITSIEKKIFFEIDHYDRHFVCYDWAVDEKKQFIWKTNLLGGSRLFHFIYRLSLLPTLNDFIGSKRNWKAIRGFEGGTRVVEKNQDRIIVTKSGELKIDRSVDICSSNLKDPFMYEIPFMIIAQVLGKNNLPVYFIPKDNDFTQKTHLYYNRDFIGISVPEKDEKMLKDIFDFIRLKKAHNQLNYQLYVLAISSSSLVLRETAIREGDILSLPFPKNKEYLGLSESEKILQEDVLKYYIHLGKAIGEKGQGRKLQEKVSQEQLKKFGETFCNVLNPIYAKNGKSWQSGIFYQTQSFTIYQFGYGKNKGLSFQMIDKLDDIIKPLIYNNTSNRGAIFTRVCRIYKHLNGYDCVFFIKPHAACYWLNSIALRDADKTFIDLKKAGR